jgi:hypothetical protein
LTVAAALAPLHGERPSNPRCGETLLGSTQNHPR